MDVKMVSLLTRKNPLRGFCLAPPPGGGAHCYFWELMRELRSDFHSFSKVVQNDSNALLMMSNDVCWSFLIAYTLNLMSTAVYRLFAR